MMKYLIKRGDSLAKIAKRYNTTVKDLAKLNKIKNINKIYAGDTILLSSTESNRRPIVEQIKAQQRTVGTNPRSVRPRSQDRNQRKREFKTGTGLTFSVDKKQTGRRERIQPESRQPSLLSRVKNKINEPVLPTNIRQLVYDVFGGNATLTENDLKSAEIKALKDAVISARSRGSGNVNYVDYGTEGGTYDDIGGSKVYGGAKELPNASLIKRINDPNYSMKTTIGQAKITKNKKGETVILDRYNFNNAKDGTFKDYLAEAKKTGTNLYNQARLVGQFFGSAPGEGSPVAINLGRI